MIEEATRKIRSEYYKSDASRTIDKTMGFFEDNAIVVVAWPAQPPCIGKDAIRKAYEEWYASFSAHQTILWEVEEVGARPVGEDEVLSHWRWYLKSPSGKVANVDGVEIFKFRNKKIVRAIGIWDIQKTEEIIKEMIK